MTQIFLFLTIIITFTIHITHEANPDGAMLVRFRNLANYDIVLWWLTPYNNEEIRFFGHLTSNGGMTSFTSYVGHRFFWAPPNQQNDKSARRGEFPIQRDQILYLYDDPKNQGSPGVVEDSYKELSFLDNYYKTYNRHWLSTLNRPKPIVPFITLNDDNSRIKWVKSDAYFWKCFDKNDSENEKKAVPKQKRMSRFFGSNSNTISACQDNNNGNKLQFMIEELYSADPRIYKISSFINEYESNHIIEISKRYMRRSTVGNGREARQDPTRTCSNTWLSMNHTAIIETVYKRIGDVLGIDQYKMTVDATVASETIDGVASHMEVIHFATNEHYSRHYDNSVEGDIFLHFITFQVVLRTSSDFSGGQTGFPHAGAVQNLNSWKNNRNQNNRNKVGYFAENEQYSAIFWYNLLPDGNLDETSMYSNTKVLSGEQWMFHVSIWDPSLPVHGDPTMPHDRMYSMHDEL